MSYRGDYRAGERQFFWTAPRAALAIVVAIALVFLILVVTTPLTIGFGWVSGEANLRSFKHVRQTYAEAFDDANALDAIARNACIAKSAVTEARNAGDANALNQRETQLLVIEQNYNRVKGEYDAYMSDHFRGGVIHPSQLPVPYPTLDARTAALCQ